MSPTTAAAAASAPGGQPPQESLQRGQEPPQDRVKKNKMNKKMKKKNKSNNHTCYLCHVRGHMARVCPLAVISNFLIANPVASEGYRALAQSLGAASTMLANSRPVNARRRSTGLEASLENLALEAEVEAEAEGLRNEEMKEEE
ncbi:hypothetical protein N7456_012039 [Penicillium angulare]|uniref:CCHC-type domain-containing protein n=1 Tax=Penicillium angulare TaxID=116970 RepID=A0A9W9K0C3_9EURO|nr:hypothetical protein N7456_012039 [Penicillium angulare]